MKVINSIFAIGVTMFISLTTSCNKYLEEKPDKKLVVPSSLQDLQYLLDNYTLMNFSFSGAAEILCDNYYFTYANWQSSNTRIRNYYVWQNYDDNAADWSDLYSGIYNANVVLDHLDQIKSNHGDEQKRNEIKGVALFFRAYLYYQLAQLFSQPYDKNTASKDLGLPLRLNSDFNEPSIRASVQETFNQIISDLMQAAILVPQAPTNKNRPAKPAVYGALARAFLSMQEYVKAGLYADSCLRLKSDIMRFDSLSTTASNPILEYNPEVIFYGSTSGGITSSRYLVDSSLYWSYDVNDLRAKIFFRSNNDGTYRAKGNYTGISGSSFFFAGIATNEMYLIRAECNARNGNVSQAMEDLNTLLINRWATGTFVPFVAADASDALTQILQERRKELQFTLTRWPDLRRLNKEAQFATEIKRVLNGQEYIIAPNGPGYTIKIPKSVIDKTGMPQNP